MLGTVKRSTAFDANRRRPGSADADAQLLEERAKFDDVRLAGGVANFGDAVGRGRGKQRGLGAGDRCLVEVDRRGLQPVWRLEDVSWTGRTARAHGAQRF